MKKSLAVYKQQEKYYDTYLKIPKDIRFQKVWKFIERNVKPGKLLDIGCADGSFCVPLIKKGWNCYGLDLLKQNVYTSKKKGLHTVIGSALEGLPYGTEIFDFVFAGEIIEHTIDDKSFLKECHRVLKSEGILILTTPNLVSLGNRILMFFGKLPRFAYSEFHYKIYNLRLIQDKLASAHFKIIKIQSNYVVISTFFNIVIGKIGEFLGNIYPKFGENLIVYCKKIHEKG